LRISAPYVDTLRPDGTGKTHHRVRKCARAKIRQDNGHKRNRSKDDVEVRWQQEDGYEDNITRFQGHEKYHGNGKRPACIDQFSNGAPEEQQIYVADSKVRVDLDRVKHSDNHRSSLFGCRRNAMLFRLHLRPEDTSITQLAVLKLHSLRHPFQKA